MDRGTNPNTLYDYTNSQSAPGTLFDNYGVLLIPSDMQHRSLSIRQHREIIRDKLEASGCECSRPLQLIKGRHHSSTFVAEVKYYKVFEEQIDSK